MLDLIIELATRFDVKARLTHWKSNAEGVMWFEIISRGWDYLTQFLKCDVSEVQNVGLMGGLVMFARFVMMKGNTVKALVPMQIVDEPHESQ